MVGLSPKFVCHGQYWLLYLPVLSVVDNNGWHITHFCMSWTYRCVYDPVLSVVDNIGWYITLFCLLWTVMVGIVPDFVCLG